jgi:PAS domain S-box-containing protein
METAHGLGGIPLSQRLLSSFVSVAERETLRGLRATIDRAPVGIAHFDLSGRFLLVNDKLCEMLGYDRPALLARGCYEVTFPEDVEACLQLNTRLASGAIPSYTLDKRCVRRDGTVVWSHICVSSVRDESGALAFFVVIAEDITEQQVARERLKETEARLLRQEQEAREAAERAARMREDMVATVAHDLRNPLHVIATATAAMQAAPLEAERRERFATLTRRSIRIMTRLVEDLLDVSRIDAGRLEVRREPVEPARILEETRELFEGRARERGIALAVSAAAGLGTVMGDHDRLVQVLSNLVDNALKFTPPGGHVELAAEARGEGVEVAVRDDGIGLAPGQLERLFDRYWKAEQGSRSGAGLGLAIARGIVRAHGGEIRAESERGRGTTIRFTIARGSPA